MSLEEHHKHHHKGMLKREHSPSNVYHKYFSPQRQGNNQGVLGSKLYEVSDRKGKSLTVTGGQKQIFNKNDVLYNTRESGLKVVTISGPDRFSSPQRYSINDKQAKQFGLQVRPLQGPIGRAFKSGTQQVFPHMGEPRF